MVNNLVGCKQPLSAMVVVVIMDTCPHLDFATDHDDPAEALRLLASCKNDNDHSVLPYDVGIAKAQKDTVKKYFDG